MTEQRDPRRWSLLSIAAAALAAIVVAYVLVGTLREERGDIVRPNTRSEAPTNAPSGAPPPTPKPGPER